MNKNKFTPTVNDNTLEDRLLLTGPADYLPNTILLPYNYKPYYNTDTPIPLTPIALDFYMDRQIDPDPLPPPSVFETDIFKADLARVKQEISDSTPIDTWNLDSGGGGDWGPDGGLFGPDMVIIKETPTPTPTLIGK
jgi:hypothetical protein